MLDIGLIDHHCHGTVKADLDQKDFEALLSESYRPPVPGTTHFDKPLGLLVRRHCAPLLDLEPFVEPEAYVERRRALGAAEVARRLLKASGIDTFLVDTGHLSSNLTNPHELEAL